MPLTDARFHNLEKIEAVDIHFHFWESLTLSQTTLPKLKEFADDNFIFDKNGIKFSKGEENTVEKRRNCSLRAISPFPVVFSKDL